MNRETESYFRELPEVHIPRSKIKKPHGLKTSWNVGDCVPIYVDEVLPGSSINMNMSAVMRMSTPLYPTMDNLYTDFLWFFVPFRLLWTHFVNMWGENENAWYPEVEYTVPQVKTSEMMQFQEKSLADYMGLPLNCAGLSVSALPFRAYVKIWNDWFRSTPLQQEAPNVMTDADDYAYTDTYLGGDLLKANKMHDLFTSCLPTAQRGPEITLPIGSVAPIYAGSRKVPEITYFNGGLDFPSTMTFKQTSGTEMGTGNHNLTATKTDVTSTSYNLTANYTAGSEATLRELQPNNLWADLSNATASTISELRIALSVQHFYEAMARYGGGRYTEFLRAIFGVISPDARLQRSEFLGGKRVPHNIATVVQTSSTDATSPQGNTGAYSHTTDSHEYFTKSFTEAGVVMCIMVTRYKHTYNQGVPKMFLHRKWSDFYLPQFNGISEVPVEQQEIYASSTGVGNKDVFGYQEYGYEYRYFQDMCTSEMRTTYAQSLDAWHYADHYTQKPVLGSEWIAEDKNNVDRTLAVSSGLSDQLLGDFYFNPTYVLPMPIYSIPGLDKI